MRHLWKITSKIFMRLSIFMEICIVKFLNVNEGYSKKFYIDVHFMLYLVKDKQACEGIVIMKGCTKAIKAMEYGKSPYMVGLADDFYRFIWSKTKHPILDSLNYAYIKGGGKYWLIKVLWHLTPHKRTVEH